MSKVIAAAHGFFASKILKIEVVSSRTLYLELCLLYEGVRGLDRSR
jgi:hypothetical protein